jgi:hypothetical protein
MPSEPKTVTLYRIDIFLGLGYHMSPGACKVCVLERTGPKLQVVDDMSCVVRVVRIVYRGLDNVQVLFFAV